MSPFQASVPEQATGSSTNAQRVDAYERHRPVVFGSTRAAGEAAPPSQTTRRASGRPRRSYPAVRGPSFVMRSVEVFILPLTPVRRSNSQFVFSK